MGERGEERGGRERRRKREGRKGEGERGGGRERRRKRGVGEREDEGGREGGKAERTWPEQTQEGWEKRGKGRGTLFGGKHKTRKTKNGTPSISGRHVPETHVLLFTTLGQRWSTLKKASFEPQLSSLGWKLLSYARPSRQQQ